MYRIYYTPDNWIETEGAELHGEKARGVQVILQPHPEVVVELVTSSDYYVLRDGRWWGVDIFGLFDFLLDSGLVLFGRTITRDEYAEVMRQAMAHKAGWLPRERRE